MKYLNVQVVKVEDCATEGSQCVIAYLMKAFVVIITYCIKWDWFVRFDLGYFPLQASACKFQ